MYSIADIAFIAFDLFALDTGELASSMQLIAQTAYVTYNGAISYGNAIYDHLLLYTIRARALAIHTRT